MLSETFKLILDVETTEFTASSDEIVQLSMIDFEGNVLFDRYLKPTRHTHWPEAESIHGISPQMVADCPSLEEVKEEI